MIGVNKMRTKNSIKNIVATLITNILNIILGMISTTLFIKFLDIEYMGINGLFSNVISMLNIAELGIGNAIVVNLYKPIREQDNEKIKSLMQFYRKTYNIIIIIMIIGGILAIPFLKYFVKDVTVPINIVLAYLLVLASSVSSYILVYKRSILYASQKNYILKIISLIYLLICNIIQIIVLFLTKNYYLYLIIKIICQLLENITISLTADYKFKYLKEKKYTKLDKATEKNIWKKVTALSIHKVSSFIVSGTDNLLISNLIGIVTVGLYSNYYMIINNIKKIFYQIMASFTASIGDLLAENNDKKTYNVFKKIKFLNNWMAIFTATCLLIITQDFIKCWLGTKYLLSNFVLFILVMNYYQNVSQRAYKNFKDAAGIWVEDKYNPIIEAILNIVCSIFFFKIFGLAGIFMGTIISSFVYWFYSYPKLIHNKIFKKSYISYYSELIFDILLFILTLYLTYNVSVLLPSTNIFIKLIIDIIICCLVPNIILLIIFHKSEEFKYYIGLVKKLINKNRKIEKQLTLSEIRKIQLEALLYLKEICDKNQINYFLTSGTLLGAVKYKGYIPWDDDIDVGLKRQEYLKLIDILNKENNPRFKILSIYTTKDYYYTFAKLVCTETKLIENTKTIKNMGVYIDIFPFDYYNDDYESYIKKIKFFRNITSKRYRQKNIIKKSINKDIESKTKFVKIKGLGYSIIDIITLPLGYKFWVKTYDKLLSKNKTGKFITRGCKNYQKFNAKMFDEFTDYEFEGYHFKSIVKADEYLTAIYGDYMKDLQKEQQRTHHQMVAYWKKQK